MHNSLLHLPVQFQDEYNWNIYAAYIEQYCLADKITNDNRKRAILLSSLSFGVFSKLWDFYFPGNPTTKTFRDICEVLEMHSKHSVYDERSKFYDAKQQKKESVLEFVVRLVDLTRKCKFVGNFTNVLRDKFVCGLLEGPVYNEVSQLGSTATFEECVEVAIEKEVYIKECLRLASTRKIIGRRSSTDSKLNRCLKLCKFYNRLIYLSKK